AIPRDQRREVATPLAAPAGGAGSSEEGVGFADSLLASAVTTRALRGSVPEQPRQLAELGARLRLRTLHLVGTRHRFSLSLACGQGSEAATFDGRSSPQRAMDFGTVDSLLFLAAHPARPELGRTDLVLTRGKERCAIDLETGKSDVVSSVRSGLRAGFG